MEALERLYPIAKEVLDDWNLFVNYNKTEYTNYVFLATKQQIKNFKL